MDPIVYVGFGQPDEWANLAGMYGRHARRFEDARGGGPCLVVPFQYASIDLLRRIGPSQIVFSGFGRSFEQYEVESFLPVAEAIETLTEIPMLMLCGAHQLNGYLFNGELKSEQRLYDKPMRARRPGEAIVNADYHPEFFMEKGFYELTVHAPDDPLFAGCGDPAVILQSHYCEIKDLPPGFQLLASTPDCRIQAMRHESRPLVSLQFHPEEWTDAFPDGRTIVENFFRGG